MVLLLLPFTSKLVLSQGAHVHTRVYPCACVCMRAMIAHLVKRRQGETHLWPGVD